MNKFLLKIIAEIFKSFICFLYPPLCLHCKESLSNDSYVFCQECAQLLIPIAPEERCPYCFTEEFAPEQLVCRKCKKNKPLINRVASVFDYFGPAATLVKQMKYGNQPYLTRGAGAYLAMQFTRLNWTKPDYIIPVPLTFLREYERGYNQSLLLAEELGKLLDIPVLNALKRKNKGFSQAGKSYEQRTQLTSEQFVLRKKMSLTDKCLLLVDDVLTTGTTLQCCAESLLEGCPASIYGLALCRAVK